MFLKGQEVPVKTMILQLYQSLKNKKEKKNETNCNISLIYIKTFKGFKDKLH